MPDSKLVTQQECGEIRQNALAWLAGDCVSYISVEQLPHLLDSLERAMRLLEGTLASDGHSYHCVYMYHLGNFGLPSEHSCICGKAERQAEVANYKGNPGGGTEVSHG